MSRALRTPGLEPVTCAGSHGSCGGGTTSFTRRPSFCPSEGGPGSTSHPSAAHLGRGRGEPAAGTERQRRGDGRGGRVRRSRGRQARGASWAELTFSASSTFPCRCHFAEVLPSRRPRSRERGCRAQRQRGAGAGRLRSRLQRRACDQIFPLLPAAFARVTRASSGGRDDAGAAHPPSCSAEPGARAPGEGGGSSRRGAGLRAA